MSEAADAPGQDQGQTARDDLARPDQPARRCIDVEVDARDAGERADVVLGRRVPALSRRQARALAHAGKLRIDGRRRSPSTRVAVGQRLELELEPAPADAGFELRELAVSERFVYVFKPAGVHTVALTPQQPGVLATAVAARWPDCAAASPDPREAGAVHRLDRPTSGVVAFARSRAVWEQARAGFAERLVAKHYLAGCTRLAPASDWPPALPEGGLKGWLAPAELEPPDPAQAEALTELRRRGRPLSAEPLRIRAPLGRDGGPRRSAVRLDGLRASTIVEPLVRLDGGLDGGLDQKLDGGVGERWLLRLVLETGRRHQARVHLAWIGLPIVGDTLYGPRGNLTGGSPGSRSEAEAGSASEAPAIQLHALSLDLHRVFASEAPVLAPPPAQLLATA